MNNSENFSVNQAQVGDDINIDGVICEKTWNKVYEEVEAIIKADTGDTSTINLSGISKADSSALSLIMELERNFKVQNKKVIVKNTPKPLQQLADLYNL